MKPNIVLVTVDCWRGDSLGIFNPDQPHQRTPNIDRIANQNHYFRNTYSCGGWTKIAMTSLFSSTPSSMYGFSRGKLSSERALLSEQLRKEGYYTAGFTTNPVCGAAQGFDIGFDEFEDMRPRRTAPVKAKVQKIKGYHHLVRRPIFHKIASAVGHDSRPFYPTPVASVLVDKAIDWLAQERDQPSFLWLHFMDLHWPYRSSLREQDSNEIAQMWIDRAEINRTKRAKGQYYPGAKRKGRWTQLYEEEVQYLDQQLGRLVDYLKKREDWKNTALCLTSDHGEEFFEHGTWGHSWNQLHSEGILSPLVLKIPEGNKPSQPRETVSHLDIAPTLLSIAGVKPDDKMQGQSLLPLCVGSHSEDYNEVPVMSEMHGHAGSHRYRLSITYKSYRYIYFGDKNRCELFDLSSDPDAKNNVYGEDTELSKKFDVLRLECVARGALQQLAKCELLGGDDLDIALDEDDPEIVERLRALGYME